MASFLNDVDTRTLESDIADVRRRLARPHSDRAAIWADYAAQAATYNGLLTEIEELDPRERRRSEAAAAAAAPPRLRRLGDRKLLPAAIVQRIDAFELDLTLLGASLRGYQDFGAKFALVQKRTILGDEMGLGKTIEALALICHLRARRATHFLVVCPASVLANWENEVLRHTQLPTPVRLHGHGRGLLPTWTRDGGVAITTFDTLRLLNIPDIDIAAVVVDEAHYVKNPAALRTQAVCACLERSQYALLMSGTPLENRLEEFRTLVDHVQPDIASTLGVVGGPHRADAFRRAVAPVYLRRNQSDVLAELPPKIETAEWLTLDGAAAYTYRRAVASGNFMLMRRAAYLTDNPADSPKLTRLLEIVDEAMDNNRKVIVYSYFRDVLDRVHAALGPRALGCPLTGSLTGPRRQELVDRFSTHHEPAVLVSQIEAGGIGLNIQAASVVIIAEPQWKPSTEEQAIARCHRMGQIRPVEVHRLLTEDSVDEHMIAVLARKSALFASYIRPSAIKDAAPAAVDSNATRSPQSTQEEHIIELERRRLGLAA